MIRIRRLMVVLLALGAPTLGGLALSATAEAADTDAGIPVKVFVVDEAGQPIKTAVVRHPQEADRHRVNTFDGSWEATSLFMPDGTEMIFAKKMILELEISAPGYQNQHIQYEIRSKKNTFTVTLAAMVIAPLEDDDDDVIIGFGGDKPIDGAGTEP